MEKTNKRIKKNIRRALIVPLLLLFVFSNTASAANLRFSPSSGTYSKNVTFSVGIYVSSTDQAMNAASATIKFPTDKLQVVSVSKSGSIIDFWAKEPSFSNGTGQITMDGVVLTPGYKGTSGKLLTVNFKGKKSGLASVNISRSSVLANDGLGTDILQNVFSANFLIEEIEARDPSIIDLEELIPIDQDTVGSETCDPDTIITSSTHPGIIWRRENTAIFTWDIKDDTVASKITFNRNPDSEPNEINNPAIVEKRYKNVEDGIWYFHLQLQDNDGWGETEHFKIKIDHTPPEIEVSEVKRVDLTDPKPIINLKISDKISCLKDFQLSINGEDLNYEKLPNGNLILDPIEPGEHELVITAHDRAGNKNESYLNIIVKALETPKVTSFDSEIMIGETMIIGGETIPNGNIEASITSKRNNFLIRRDFQSGSGKFTFEEDNLRRGRVFVSFRVSDSRGAMSAWSHPIEIRIKGNGLLGFKSLLNLFGIELVIAFGILLLIAIVLLTRHLTIQAIRRKYES